MSGFGLKIRSLSVSWALLSIIGTAQADQTRIQDVIYGFKYHEGVALTLDVFKPSKPNGIGVIWVMSGGWFSQRDQINPQLAKIFTDRGDTVFEVVHGSQPKFDLSEIMPDVHRAVRFIRSHATQYGVDPNRLGIAGASAGGHLSLIIGANGRPGDPAAKDLVDRASSEVEAVACFFPPTDFMNYGATGREAFLVPNMQPYWAAFGITDKTPKQELEMKARMYSPIYGVTSSMPPTLVIHGDADTLVPIQQSQILMEKLEQLKVPHQLIVKKGVGHGWPTLFMDLPSIADWFDKYLAKK